jgi:hypothetical protein
MDSNGPCVGMLTGQRLAMWGSGRQMAESDSSLSSCDPLGMGRIRFLVVALALALALAPLCACGSEPPERNGGTERAGDTAPVLRDEGAPSVKTTPAVSETSMASVVGLWDDGLVGENTKLDLRADGGAHIVSMAVVPAAWTLDADSLRVTITSRRQADGSTVTQNLTYTPGEDVLTGRFSEPNGPEHVFRRASQDAITWWSRVRPRVEAEEARSSGREADVEVRPGPRRCAPGC